MTTPALTPAHVRNHLSDQYGRVITYLRLSITDRCNLRCGYCMPEQGVQFKQHSELLSYEELIRLSSLFIRMGIKKIRITGGEPFVRKDCMRFLTSLKLLNPSLDLRVTTNGVSLLEHLETLKTIGIGGINLSLDTLDPARFLQITRKDRFNDVYAAFQEILRLEIPLKINAVVQPETPDRDLHMLAQLAMNSPIEVRFIEFMPFSGKARDDAMTQLLLEQRLHNFFPELRPLTFKPGETARKFALPGYQGSLGIIEGEGRKFCNSCNKLRITPFGAMKNCLYDSGVLDLREMLRNGCDDKEIVSRITSAIQNKHLNGHHTARLHDGEQGQSMSMIGG